MPHVKVTPHGETHQYFLDDRALANGDTVEFRLGGNRGWMTVTIAGLPDALRVQWHGDDQQLRHTTVPPEAQLRWAE